MNIPDLVPRLPAAPQTSSPLFSVLPAEIRNHIYALSLESEDVTLDDSPRSLYQRNAFYYRPGYKQPKRIESSLLQTCQQIYAEASLLPPGINEHTFWFYRSPPHVKDASSPVDYFRKMTPKQRAQVNHIHLFTQQFFLEDDRWSDIWDGMQMSNEGRTTRGTCRIAPKKLTITFRHTDWWYWENNDPLGIDPFRQGRTRAHEMGRPVHINPWQSSPSRPAWGNQFHSIPSLEEFVIEFETIMRKRDQLDAIIQQALQWKFPLDEENSIYLVAEPASLSAYSWIGAKEGDLIRQRPAIYREPRTPGQELHLPPDSEADVEADNVHLAPTLKIFDPQSQSTARGGAVAGGPSASDLNREEFYVVFLTWRKQVVKE
jgi:hypothetical protein